MMGVAGQQQYMKLSPRIEALVKFAEVRRVR